MAQCLISALPTLCSGCVISDGQYVTSAVATYNIGKLRTVLPTYDPTNTLLTSGGYCFTPDDVKKVWEADAYPISGGVIVSGTSVISSGGVCDSRGYNTVNDEHLIISWVNAANSAGSSSSA